MNKDVIPRWTYISLISINTGLFASSFILACISILTGIGRLGGVAAVCGVSGIILALVFSTYMLNFNVAPKPLPRRQRRELQRELDRIALAKAIQEAEKEAGLL